jgi:hypothetical protein
MIKRRFITLGELEKKYSTCLQIVLIKCSTSSQIVLIVKSLHKVKWDLKRVSNFIQMINDYNVVNKYDLTWQIHSMLKCLTILMKI